MAHKHSFVRREFASQYRCEETQPLVTFTYFWIKYKEWTWLSSLCPAPFGPIDLCPPQLLTWNLSLNVLEHGGRVIKFVTTRTHFQCDVHVAMYRKCEQQARQAIIDGGSPLGRAYIAAGTPREKSQYSTSSDSRRLCVCIVARQQNSLVIRVGLTAS